MNTLSARAMECASDPARSWRTVPAAWGVIFILLGGFIVLLSNAIVRDRKEIRFVKALIGEKKREQERAAQRKLEREKRRAERKARIAEARNQRRRGNPGGAPAGDSGAATRQSTVSRLTRQPTVSRLTAKRGTSEAGPRPGASQRTPTMPKFSARRSLQKAKMGAELAAESAMGHQQDEACRAPASDTTEPQGAPTAPKPRKVGINFSSKRSLQKAKIGAELAAERAVKGPTVAAENVVEAATVAAEPKVGEAAMTPVVTLPSAPPSPPEPGAAPGTEPGAAPSTEPGAAPGTESGAAAQSKPPPACMAALMAKKNPGAAGVLGTFAATGGATAEGQEAPACMAALLAKPKKDPNASVAALLAKKSAGSEGADGATPASGLAGGRWKMVKKDVHQEALKKNVGTTWHKTVDSVPKRLCQALVLQHTLCTGILYRGSGGYTRAQTCMILMNSFAFELMMLLFFYAPPAPPVPGAPLLSINIPGLIIGSTYAAVIVIPTMLTFSWLYEPIIFVNVGKYVFLQVFCSPCNLAECIWKTPGRIKRTIYGLIRAVRRRPMPKYGLPTTVVFQKEAGERLGVILTGGPRLKFVVVHAITEDSQAIGQLHVGDRVDAVNGVFIKNGTHGSKLILAAGPEVRLLVRKVDTTTWWSIHKAPKEGKNGDEETGDEETGKPVLAVPISSTAADLPTAVATPPPSPPASTNEANKRRLQQGVTKMKDIMLKVKVAPAPMGEDALAAQDEADLAAEEAKSAMEELQAMNEQQFSYESLNDVLLKASLTESWNRKDWPAVRKILFGWGGNLFLFITMIFLGLFYTCELFEPELDDDKQIIVYPPPPPPQPPALPGLNASECFNVTECNFTSPDRTPGPVSDLWIQWSLSGFQRFVCSQRSNPVEPRMTRAFLCTSDACTPRRC